MKLKSKYNFVVIVVWNSYFISIVLQQQKKKRKRKRKKMREKMSLLNNTIQIFELD